MAPNLHLISKEKTRIVASMNMKKVIKIFVVLSLAVMFSISAFAQTSLTALDGSVVNVENQPGKVVVLAIGPAWLPLSSKQADFANQISKKYAGKNVVVYFVMTDSLTAKSKNYASNDDLKAFALKYNIAVPVLRDPDGGLLVRKFKIEQVPSFLILDKKGAPAGDPFGGIDPKYDITVPISKEIDRLLAG